MELVNAGVHQFELDCSLLSISFNLEALQYILSQSTGNVILTIAPVTGLSGDARTAIGRRPVYAIIMRCIKDGKIVDISRLGRGSFILSIPYDLDDGESAGYVFGVTVGRGGAITRINHSAYDDNRNSVILTGNRFTIYGVGYEAPSNAFDDISEHS